MKRSYGLAQAIRTFGLKVQLIRKDTDERGATRFTYYVYRPDAGKAVEMQLASWFSTHDRMNDEAAEALAYELGKENNADFDAGEWLRKRSSRYAGKFMPAHAIAELLWHLNMTSNRGGSVRVSRLRKLRPEWKLVDGNWYEVVRDFSSDDYNGGEVIYWLLGKGGWLDNANDCFTSDILELKWG